MKNIFPFILRNIFLRIVPESGGAYGIFKIFWCARRQFFGYAKLMRIFDDARKKNAAMRGVFLHLETVFLFSPAAGPFVNTYYQILVVACIFKGAYKLEGVVFFLNLLL